MKRIQIWVSDKADKKIKDYQKKHDGSKAEIASQAICAGLPKLAEFEKIKSNLLTGG